MKLVFVSSTFKDMQFERDLLQTYAIPTLNEQLREYGERAYFGDLRWGVNTTDLDSDEGSRKVLKVCLDQIDNCKPYMIVLVGERYGWIPAQELIDEACVLKGIDRIQDISVTELEIDYGALLNPEYAGRILFYFRNLDKTGMTDEQRRDYEAESHVHLQKVEALKQRIEEIYPDHIRYYDAVWDAASQKVTGLENFLSRVEADLGNALLRDLEAENHLPWQERSMRAAHRHFEETNKTLVPLCNFRVVYAGSAQTDSAPFLYVTGEAGSGKSSMVISSYCASQREKLAFSFGLDKFSRNSADFARILIYKIEEIAGYEHKEYAEETLPEEIFNLLSGLKTPLHIYIDNAQEDFLQTLSLWEMSWSERETPIKINAQFMIAVQDELPFYPFYALSGKAVMQRLSRAESGQVLDSIVRSNHKEISPVVKTRILSKDNSNCAGYLKNIVKRLMILDSEDFAVIRAMGDGMDNINNYMISIVDNTADGRYEILSELIEEAQDRINFIFVQRIMELFTHVPVALSIEDVRGIFTAYGWDFNDLDFSLAVQMLEDVLHYNSNNHLYKIKNQEIAKHLCHTDAAWDALPAAEYMLQDKELRPYAFKAAVLDAKPDDLCLILKRSEIADITDSIRYLVERGFKEKAIQLLLAVADHEELWAVKRLPTFRDFKPDARTRVYVFLGELAEACNARLAKDKLLLLEMDLDARFAVAEYALDIDPQITINMLIRADELLRQYAQKMDVAVINRMYFLMLKAVNKTKSQALFDTYIGSEAYLNIFHYTDEYDESIFKMKVYTEFSEIVGVFDAVLEEKYHALAYELATKADSLLCIGEDFAYIAKLTETFSWILQGKALYPFDLNLLRAEIERNLEDKQIDPVDVMGKAEALWKCTESMPDCIRYWRSILYYFAHLYDNDEMLEESAVERYISLTRILTEERLSVSDYVDILHCASMLDYVDDVERLLDAAKCDGEPEKVVQDMIRSYYIEEDLEEFLSVMEAFNERKEGYTGAACIAARTIEAYFEMLTEEA